MKSGWLSIRIPMPREILDFSRDLRLPLRRDVRLLNISQSGSEIFVRETIGNEENGIALSFRSADFANCSERLRDVCLRGMFGQSDQRVIRGRPNRKGVN